MEAAINTVLKRSYPFLNYERLQGGTRLIFYCCLAFKPFSERIGLLLRLNLRLGLEQIVYQAV